MKRVKFIGMAFCALVAGTVLFAQTPPAPPSGPLIAKAAPDFAQWTVTTKFKSTAPAAGVNPTPSVPAPTTAEISGPVVKVVKTGNIYHISTARGNGTKTETWCEGEMQVITCPEWHLPVLSTGERRDDAARVDLSHGDFAGFEWISAKNFVGIRKTGGQDCLIFQDNVPMGPAIATAGNAKPNSGMPEPRHTMVPVMAAIDLATRLPVSLQSGDATTTYTFDSPPTSKQSLPAEIQAVIDNWIAVKKRIAHVPVHP